jgi:hypothetical protein
MVTRQRKKWPWTDPARKFVQSKTPMNVLKEVLLDASYGFTVAGSSMSSGLAHLSAHAAPAAANSGGDAMDAQVEGEVPQAEGGTHNDSEGSALVRLLLQAFFCFLCHLLISHNNSRKEGWSGLLQSSSKTGASHLQ